MENVQQQTTTLKQISFDPLQYVNKITPFDGKSTAELVRFIEKVKVLELALTDYEPSSISFLTTQIRDKITGKANEALLKHTLVNYNWKSIQEILINNFGERETYLQIKEKGERTRFHNVYQLYNELLEILSRMNNKYHLSSDKPVDRTPESNEQVILNIFKEKLPMNAASIIIARNIQTLNEAYQVLEENNWTRYKSFNKYDNSKNYNNQSFRYYNNNYNDKYKKQTNNYSYNNNYQNQRYNNQNYNYNQNNYSNQYNRPNQNYNQNTNYNKRYNQNNNDNFNNIYSNQRFQQVNGNLNQNNQQFNQNGNKNYNNEKSTQRFNQRSNQTRFSKNWNRSGQNRVQEEPVPMEVDENHVENFQRPASPTESSR